MRIVFHAKSCNNANAKILMIKLNAPKSFKKIKRMEIVKKY